MAFDTPICFNLTSRTFVESAENPKKSSAPIAIYGDVPTWQCTFLENLAERNTSVKSSVGVSLRVLIINSVGTVLTFADAGTAVNDIFPVILPLTTAEFLAAIPALPSSVAGELQFVFSIAGAETTFTHPITLKKRNAGVVTITPIPPEVAATSSELRTFALAKDGTGDTADIKIWVSPDGTRKRIEYLGNDGQMHNDPIT